MTQEKIATYFEALTTSTQALARDADISMIDALIEVLEDIHAGNIQHELNIPTAETIDKIQSLITDFDWQNMTQADLRKVLQLVILKAVKIYFKYKKLKNESFIYFSSKFKYSNPAQNI